MRSPRCHVKHRGLLALRRRLQTQDPVSGFVLWEQRQIVKVGATVAQVGAALAIIDHFVQVELHMQHPFGLFGQLGHHVARGLHTFVWPGMTS